MLDIEFVSLRPVAYSPSGERVSIELKGYHVMVSPITNGQFIKLTKNHFLENRTGQSYTFVNDVDPNFPLKYCGSGEWTCVVGLENHPVRGLSWYGAQKVAGLLGGGLPTELEWEAIAYSSFDEPVDRDRFACPPDRANCDNTHGGTTPIGKFPPSKNGLYDLFGNVREWCADTYQPEQRYSSDRVPPIEDSSFRVLKGGGWDKPTSHLSIKYSSRKWPRLGTASSGARIVVRGEKTVAFQETETP